MAEFKNIPLKTIEADPNQPRKFYDETALQELTDSVRENGVIQPILVRPAGKNKYMLVCGERRYRAALAVMTAIKDKDTIPAVIRELTDHQALELQIIENLQRKDVHPMEEAVAFKSLLESKQMFVVEIAARVGKSEYYIRQRLKLNELSDAWQKAFFANMVNLKGAMAICQLPIQAQDSLYNNKRIEQVQPGRWVTIENWDIEKYRGDLHRAAFDVNDHMLIPGKGGACTACQFNSAVSLLFPEEAKSPRCMNINCFEQKTEAHSKRELEVAIADPTIILVSDHYSLHDKAKKLVKEGHLVLSSSEYREEAPPEYPNLEELRDNYEDELHEGDMTEQDIQKEYEELVAQYDQDVKVYDKKIASGKYKRAFVVEGNDVGKYVHVALYDKAAAKTTKAAVEAGNDVTVADIDGEITRLKDREKRNKELDAEKVHKRITEELKILPGFYDNKLDLSSSEYVALGILLYDTADPTTAEWLSKKLKFDRYDWNKMPVYKKLSALPVPDLKGVVHTLIRRCLMDKLVKDGDDPSRRGTAASMRAISVDYMPALVQLFDEEQEQVATKRGKKVNERITELEKKKADIVPPPPPAAKKSTPSKKSKS